MNATIIGVLLFSVCPEAREARWAGDAAGAESAARACIRRAPEDPDALLEMSRAKALVDDLDEALEWADRAVAAAPDAPDPRTWRARLHYWRGDDARARADLAPVLERFEAPEAWELAGRLAMSSGDPRRAEALYTTSLALGPTPPARVGRARARAQLGRTTGAFADLNAVCRADGCAGRERWWRNLAPVAVQAESEVLAGLASGGVQVDARLEGRLATPFGLRIGPAASTRLRTDADGDAALGAVASQDLGGRLRLNADVRFSLLDGTLPDADARGGLTIAGLGPLWLELNGRYIADGDGSAAIAEPTLCGDAGPWGGCGRYWLVAGDSAPTAASDDEGAGGPRHFGMAQGWFNASRRITLRAGAGGGNTNDFMIARLPEDVLWSAVGYGGVEWLVSRQHAVGATFTYRHEARNDEPLDLVQVGVSYALRLGW